MSDEPRPHTSRFGLILMLVAVGGSAVGVMGWHLLSNRNAGLDTSGFDMSVAPETRPSAARAPVASAPAPDAPAAPTSLGMVKSDAGMRAPRPGAASPAQTKSAGAPDDPKAAAYANFTEAAAKNEKLVDAYIRRMQAKYPSIGQYGKDWVKHADLVALRDQYWRDKDPMKFAQGLVKSDGFSQLVKKYAGDPGVRAVLIGAVKEAPATLMSAVGGVLSNDKVTKDLVNTVMKAVGLPPSLIPMLDGSDTKAPDANQVMADIMKSPDVQKSMKSQQAPVSLDQKDVDKAKEQAAPNGFTPLGGR